MVLQIGNQSCAKSSNKFSIRQTRKSRTTSSAITPGAPLPDTDSQLLDEGLTEP